MGAMGVVGASVVAVAVVVVLALAGVGAYVWYQQEQTGIVTRDTGRLRHALAECRGPRAPDSVRVHLVVQGGRTYSVDLMDDAPDRVTRCVEDVFRKATWSTDARVELVVPVDFK